MSDWTLSSRPTAWTLIDREEGDYKPTLMRLENDTGYWLWEDGSRIMWEAGDTGTPWMLASRPTAWTIGNQ
jgi:hypothetical protein